MAATTEVIGSWKPDPFQQIGKYPIAGDESIMSEKEHGTTS